MGVTSEHAPESTVPKNKTLEFKFTKSTSTVVFSRRIPGMFPTLWMRKLSRRRMLSMLHRHVEFCTNFDRTGSLTLLYVGELSRYYAPQWRP
jgi:hypothetical protein